MLSTKFDATTARDKDLAPIYIYGAGGHGQVVSDFFYPTRVPVFVDDLPLEGALAPESIPDKADVVIAIGDNSIREKVHHFLHHSGKHLSFPVVQHFSAVLSSRSHIGEGSMLCASSTIVIGAHLGRFCIVNTGASIDHDCRLGDFVHVAPGVRLCGTVSVGARTLVGTGSVVRPEITIGSDTVIGAGSVVVSDVPAGVVAFGNPCKVVRER